MTPSRPELNVDEYLQGVRGCDIAVLARAVTLIESNRADHRSLAEELLARLLPHAGRSIRVGVTGAPGAGKSTFIDTAGSHLVQQGRRIAVLAVDPSSGVSGGSILGDKTRMVRLAHEPQAFIRPSPSAGTLGGVARKTRESLLLCEAAGFDIVLIETVGVGQSETMVAEMTDCLLALMLPGAGDELQALKRGLLERVDVIAVNKADGATQQAAELAAQQLVAVLSALSGAADGDPPVLTCSALHDRGIPAVWQAVAERHAAKRASGELGQLRREQNVQWMWHCIDEQLRQALRSNAAAAAIRDRLEREVFTGHATPESAARQLLHALGLR